MAHRWVITLIALFAIACLKLPVDLGTQSIHQHSIAVSSPPAPRAVASLADDSRVTINIYFPTVKFKNGNVATDGTIILLMYGTPEYEAARCMVSNGACGPMVVSVPKSQFGDYGFGIWQDGTPRNTASVLLIHQVEVK